MHKTDDCTVRYAIFEDPDTRQRQLFLIGVVGERWDSLERRDYEDRCQTLFRRLKQDIIDPARDRMISGTEFSDRLGRHAERAYPYYVLADERLWRKVDNSREIFLPLSAEEVQVLEDLLAGKNLPTVIEGRAGSGKTTLLTYYIPERLLGIDGEGEKASSSRRLLFLTQSDRLRELAEGTIRQLLDRLRDERGCEETSLRPEYLTFHRFALNQLPVNRRQRFAERSSRSGWISFFKFRALLTDPVRGIRTRLTREAANPEIAWFVIRSYIKGFKIHESGEDRWLTPDEYEDNEFINRRDRQISADLYREVWERIWPWYKALTVPCPENGFEPRCWDDLDLAWEVVLHRSPEAPTYAVLVCDEVQDFTRIEFAAAFGALDWTRYDLSGISLDRIPVLLAGDAHQTVNPSCFRWARVKVDCARALVQHLPKCDLPRVTPFELRYNYRNARSIARLCNTLQAFRQSTLGAQAELQKIWQTPEEVPNQTVRRLIIQPSDYLLRDLLQQGVLAVGPEPYTDEERVAATFWRSLGISNCQTELPSYVTPADIKGLEHDFVAVVGFGTLFKQLGLDEVFKWRNAIEDAGIPEHRRLTAEYFLNRLYVALSRPRQGLWIVETPEGWEAFWAKLGEWDSQRLSDLGADADSETGFSWVDGDTRQLLGEFSKSFGELASEFEKLALEQMNPQHAERAAFYYRLVGNTVAERRMLAHKAYFEDRVVEAADTLWELGEYERASDWYWEAAAWDRLDQEGIMPSYRRELARRMLEPRERRQQTWVGEIYGFLREQTSLIKIAFLERPREWPTWTSVVVELLEGSLADTIPGERKREVLDLLSGYEVTERNWNRHLGRLAFQLGDYEDAAKYWEKVGETQTADYFRAKARTTEYPECLRWWESAMEPGEVVYQYETHPTVRLPDEERRRVARAASGLGRFELALRLLAGLDARQAAETWKKLVTSSALDRTTWESFVRIMVNTVQQEADVISPLEKSDLEGLDTLEAPAWVRRWTVFLFDMIVSLAEDPQMSENEELFWEPMVFGLRLGVLPGLLRNRFRRVWEGREAPHTRWPIYLNLLRRLLKQVAKECQLCYKGGHHEGAVNLGLLALDLLFRWQHNRDRREDNQGQPRLQAIPVFVDPSATGGAGFFLLEPEFRSMLRDALRCIADAPPQWGPSLTEVLDVTLARAWQDRIQAVSYALSQEVFRMLTTSADSAPPASFEELLLAGKFIEQSPFFRAAVDYYRQLIDLFEQRGAPQEAVRLAKERLWNAEQRHQQFVETRHIQIVRPGDERETQLVRVRSLEDRPEVIIEILPDLYRLRFRYLLDESRGTLTWDPELRVRGPLIRDGARVWEVTWRGDKFEIASEGREELIIQADRLVRAILANRPTA